MCIRDSSLATITRHRFFGSYAWDLGIFDQAMWNTLQGKPFYYTCELYMNPSGCFLGVHFSPVLFLIVPFYALWPGPETLLVIQSSCLALTALPIYWLARDRLGSRLFAFSLAISYLLYAPIHMANWFDFHAEFLIPASLAFAYYYYDRGRYGRSLLWAILALSCIEFVPFIIMSFGLYCIVRAVLAEVRGEVRRSSYWAGRVRKDVFFGFSVMALGVCWLVGAMAVIRMVNPYSADPSGLAFENWARWGNGFLEVAINVISRPLEALIFMFRPLKLAHLCLIAAPLLFLPLLSPLEFFLLAGPWLAVAFLSDYVLYLAGLQYSTFTAAQLFVATLKTVEALRDPDSILRRLLARSRKAVSKPWDLTGISRLLILANLIVAVACSPLGLNPMDFFSTPQKGPREELLEKVISLIPRGSRVLAQNEIFPHICHHYEVYAFIVPNVTFDYIVVDIKRLGFDEFKPPRSRLIRLKYQVEELLGTYDYGLLASADGILLYKLNYTGPLVLYAPYEVVFDCESISLLNGFLHVEASSESGWVLAHGPGDSVGAFWETSPWHLPPGTFNFTLRLKVGGEVEGPILILKVTSSKGVRTLAELVISGEDLPADEWVEISFCLCLEELTIDVGVSCFCLDNSTWVYVDYLGVRQVSPP
mgnify:CR=1 FL=1